QGAPRRRTKHRRKVEGARVPRHRAGKFLPRHKLRQERLAGRPEERARESSRKEAAVDPENISVKGGNQRQTNTRQRSQKNHAENRALAWVIVGDVAGGKNEQDHRHHLCEADQSQRERGTRALVKLPSYRDRQHLLPQRGDETRNQIKREITVSKNGVRIVACSGAGRW